MLLIIITYYRSIFMVSYGFYVAFFIFSTCYSLAWDLTMDWGLLRCWKIGKFGLRDRIKYPPILYYYSMIMNTGLRFAWLLTLIPADHFSDDFNSV